ncbi:MAG: glutamate carboxypeptidase [Anaerolineaceae bacterium]|nr:MAG: glutamate carboxypeptidase [Anaerolineaceae bacterium]
MNFTAQVPQMLALLCRLVETESPSRDKAAVDRVGFIVADECRRLGADVTIHARAEAGDLVEARFPHPQPLSQKREREDGILLLAHMDTVFPLGTLEKMPFYEKDGKVYGPGVSDMKGGIVVALTALASIGTGNLPRPVTALFTPDEEIGSRASRAVIEKLAKESALVLVLEPGMVDGSVKTWRKGVGEFRLTVRGRAAHAGGDHEQGRNAIEEMAHQVIAVQKLTDYARGTTLNVGVVRGGIASNVVPDEAVAEVDLRVMQPGEAERITAAMQALKPVLNGTSVEVTGGLDRPPMPLDDTMKATFAKAQAIAARHGIELKAGGTGGASDANFVAPLGVPVLDGLGPAGGEYHSEREFIFKDSLPERAKLLTAILLEW